MKTATIAAALLAASFAGPAAAQKASPAPPPSAPTSAPAPATTPAPDTPGRAVWSKTYDDARQNAKAQGKVVFVEFTQKKCGNCFRMDGLLYPSANFEMALLRTVPVKLDFGGAEAVALKNRYQINDTPAILVVSPGGALIFRMVGFDNDRAFYTHLHNSMTDWDRLNLKLVHEPETIHDAKSQLQLGMELFRRFDSEEAIPRLERAASPKSPAAVREQALAYLASAQMERERFAEAGATVDTLLRITKNTGQREKAELFRAQLALAQGKRDEARREFQAFLTRHPASKLKDQAKMYLDQMGSDQPKSE